MNLAFIPGASFHNTGYLYKMKFLGATSLFCPSLKKGPYSPENYSTPSFMSTDGGGSIRGAYFYNPRVTSTNAGPGNTIRKYKKTSDIAGTEAHRLFATDVMVGIDPNYGFPHARDKGVNVLYTDGAAAFTHNPAAWNFIATITTDDYVKYDTVFNMLEKH